LPFLLVLGVLELGGEEEEEEASVGFPCRETHLLT
jgi:hypothetical protein